MLLPIDLKAMRTKKFIIFFIYYMNEWVNHNSIIKHATLPSLSSPIDTAKENKAKNNIDLWGIVSDMVHPESTATQASANKCIGGILIACLAVHLLSFWVLLLWKIKLGYALCKDVFHRTESIKKYSWLVRNSAFFSHYISNLLLICEMLDQCNQHLWHDWRGPNDPDMWKCHSDELEFHTCVMFHEILADQSRPKVMGTSSRLSLPSELSKLITPRSRPCLTT